MASTRSAYGLDSRPDTGWYRQALCRDKPPVWWESLTGGTASRGNRSALALCHACPVREQCRDEMLAGKPSGIIAGGWRWDALGRPAPYPGDEHLVEAAPPRRGGWRRRADRPEVKTSA